LVICALPLALALPLGGCINDPFLQAQPSGPAKSSAASPAEPAAAVITEESSAAQTISMVPTQVLQPAPEVFTSEEWALWDGQRTMGGRWVALPDIALSTRVRITNAETGTSTDGALILRDSSLAGPRLIISSDAAQALGLRPGVAATVELVALEFAAVPEPPSGVDEAVGAPQGPTPVARPVRRVAAPGVQQAAVPGPSHATAKEATQEQEPRPVPVPASPAPTPPPAPPQTSTPAVSTESLPADSPTTPPEDSPADPPGIVPSAAPQPAIQGAISDGLRYIQAGIFADPANATRLIGQLQAAGLSAKALIMQRGTRNLTRVLVGPFDSIEARDEALSTVRRIGPEDATLVRG
jgi:cell division protein FtsN